MKYVYVYIYICSILYTYTYIYIYTYIETCISLSVQVAQKNPASKWMIRGEGYGPQICGPKAVPFKELTYRFAYPTLKKETHLPKQLGMDYVSLRSVSELQFWSVAQGVFYLVCCIFEPSTFLT